MNQCLIMKPERQTLMLSKYDSRNALKNAVGIELYSYGGQHVHSE